MVVLASRDAPMDGPERQAARAKEEARRRTATNMANLTYPLYVHLIENTTEERA